MVTIKIREVGKNKNCLVEMDGKDITSSLRGVRVSMKAGRLSRVFLDLIPSVLDIELGEVKVRQNPHPRITSENITNRRPRPSKQE